MKKTTMNMLLIHLAQVHHLDADTLARGLVNGDLFNMHRRAHEVMLTNGDIFHRD